MNKEQSKPSWDTALPLRDKFCNILQKFTKE